VNYDLDAELFELRAESAKSATLRMRRDGQWTELPLGARR
jgi:hypothetical protein